MSSSSIGIPVDAGLLSHMLLVGSRSPNKLLIAKASGKIHQLEFYPNYNSQCLLERNESVPFRLTRNLTSLFTPYGVEGWFVSTLTAAAEVGLSPSCACFLDGLWMRLFQEVNGGNYVTLWRKWSVGLCLACQPTAQHPVVYEKSFSFPRMDK